MRERSQEELLAMAAEAAERDLARLLESGLTITPGLIASMARKAAEEQAEEDFDGLDEADEEVVEQEETKPWWKFW